MRYSSWFKIRWYRAIGIPLLIFVSFVVWIGAIQPRLFWVEEPLDGSMIQQVASRPITSENVQNLVLSTEMAVPRYEHTLINQIAFNYNNTLLAIPYNNQIDVWNINTQQLVFTLNPFEEPVRAIAFHPEENILVVSESGGQGAILTRGDVVVFDVDKGEEVTRLSGHEAIVHAISFNTESSLIAGADNSGVILWDLENYSYITTLTNNMPRQDTPQIGHGIRDVDFNADGTLIAASTDYASVLVYETNSQELVYRLEPDTEAQYFSGLIISNVYLLPDTTYVLFDFAHSTIAMDYTTNHIIFELDGSLNLTHNWLGNLIVHVCSPDGGETRGICFTNTQTQQVIIFPEISGIYAFSNDFMKFATISSSEVRVWEVKE